MSKLFIYIALLIVSASLLMLTNAVSAAPTATLNVCTSGCTYTSIGAALVDANDGGTIQILTATITEADINITKDVTIAGLGEGVSMATAVR